MAPSVQQGAEQVVESRCDCDRAAVTDRRSCRLLLIAAARAADAAPRPSRALPLVDETAAASAARGMRALATFSYRGVDITYRELPDAESNLLFGNVCWPAAETLARMFIDQARGGAKIWTSEASMQLGVPLELLLSKRFGGIKVGPPPFPSGLDRLGLASMVPTSRVINCRCSRLVRALA